MGMRLAKYLGFALMVLTVAVPLEAVETTFWQVGSFDEFLQGTLTNVSLSKEGDLTLAPEAKVMFSPEEALATALARDSKGNLYVGTGHQGKVFRLGSDQKVTPFFTAQEPDIFAMAVGPDGSLFVGSSPSGKIYKVGADGKSSVFYTPKCKYIWALMFDAQGRLYVGTGDKGEILRVDPSGKGEVFFDSKQTHIMCLALDPKGDILAGSVPNGLVYRITPAGRAFVIYQAALPEVHDLAVDSRGDIYAATLGGSGGKGSPELLLPSTGGAAGGAVATITVTASTESDTQVAKGQTPSDESPLLSFNRSTQPAISLPPLSFSLGHGAIVKISPDSDVETVWSSNTESVFGLALRGDHVLFSTDSDGRIFDLEPRRDGENLTLLAETHQTLATCLLESGPDLYVTTGNVARLLRLQASPAREGTFEAPVKDTKFVSRWGVLAWRGSVPEGSDMKFYTRSGNSDRPDQTWSDWSGLYSNPRGDAVTSPPARFIQWKAVLGASGNARPVLNEVTISYPNQNLPPQIRSLSVSTTGERTGVVGVNVPPGSGITVSTSPSVSSSPPATTNPPVKTPVTLTWQADDPNGDQLVYSLYVKGTDETEWHLLKDKLHQTVYTIEPTALADGKYVARLVASDEESNPPNLARKSELQSAPFWVDNTPPDVEVGRATVTGSAAEVRFEVEDSTSPLRSAETSLDGRDWHDALSDDGLVDSRKETFTLLSSPTCRRGNTSFR